MSMHNGIMDPQLLFICQASMSICKMYEYGVQKHNSTSVITWHKIHGVVCCKRVANCFRTLDML